MLFAPAWQPVCLGLALSLAVTVVNAEPASYESGARLFAAEMANRHAFDHGALRAMLAQAEYRQDIIDIMRRPAESKPWHEYRAIFLTPARISGGVRFLRTNQSILQRAQAEHGVPPEIITAIIGVETNYGGNLGKHRVIDALTTLGFSYPKRAEFFRGELEAFLLLAREEGLDPLSVVGSYAGAVGQPQFIPSSYRAYAIDFDGDGRRDLWQSAADVIGSVANYIARHGWEAGEPVAFPLRIDDEPPLDLPMLEKAPAEPSLSAATLSAAGLALPETLSPSSRVNLIRLDAPEDEFWAALTNFYVITRYNHSNLYAMAVFQLSREIRESYRAAE